MDGLALEVEALHVLQAQPEVDRPAAGPRIAPRVLAQRAGDLEALLVEVADAKHPDALATRVSTSLRALVVLVPLVDISARS